MRLRSIAVAMLVMASAACGGGQAATSSTTSAPAGASASTGTTASAAPTGATPGATTGAVDLSALDACTLLDVAVVEALTGESGFRTQRMDGGPSGDKCFWGADRPGVPQYVEVTVSQAKSLVVFNFDAAAGCTEIPVSAAGVEAVGADCTSPQHKVYFRAYASGVMVQILVYEPKGATTPQDLADTAKTILDGLL